MSTIAYVIAGSEATGGAGLQADLKTFERLGVYGVGTITCIVSFDPKSNWGHRFVPVASRVIADWIEAATSAHSLGVVKIGMLGTPDTVSTVASSLALQPWRHVVVDPVLICKGQEPGAALDTDNAQRTEILPLATVVTPNLPEAETLLEKKIRSLTEMEAAARELSGAYGCAVLLKGGHLGEAACTDLLFENDNLHRYTSPRLNTPASHGTGCTLAAAVAS